MRDSKTLEEYNSVSHRLLQAEIKTEKLIATAEDITSQFMIIKKTSEKHSVIAENNKTLELLLAKTRAETEASISKQELMLEDFEKRFRCIELSNEENNEKFEKVQAQTIALKYPIKDLYEKLDVLAKAAEADQLKNEASFEKVLKYVENMEQKFSGQSQRYDEQSVVTEHTPKHDPARAPYNIQIKVSDDDQTRTKNDDQIKAIIDEQIRVTN